MMDVFKLISIVFTLIMVNGLIETASARHTQDTHTNFLWEKIWEHIQADNKLLEQTRTNSTHGSSNIRNTPPLPKDDKKWMVLLQELLDARMKPTESIPTQMATTTTTTPVPAATSRENIDVQKLLSFIAKSKMELDNEQWMSLLRFIMMSNEYKKKTTTTPPPTTTPMNHRSFPPSTPNPTADNKLKNGKELSDGEWTQRLQTMLDNPAQMDALKTVDKVTPKATTTTNSPPKQPMDTISDDQWELLLEEYLIEKQNQKEAVESSSLTPAPTITSRHPSTTPPNDNGFNNRWQFLVEQYLKRYKKQNVNNLDQIFSSPIPNLDMTTSTTTADKSDDQWLLLLDQYLLEQNGNRARTPTPEKPSASTTISGISDDKWNLLLNQYLNENGNKKNDKLATTISSSSPPTETTTTTTAATTISSSSLPKETTTTAASTHDLSDQQWQFMLNQYLNQNQLQKEINLHHPTPPTSMANTKVGDLTDEQWETLLKKYLNDNKQGGKFITSTPSTIPSTAASATTTRHIATTDKERQNPDQRWQRRLQEKLDGSPSQKGSRPTLPPKPNDQQWQERLQHKLDGSPSQKGGDNLSDKEWYTLLEETLTGDKKLAQNSGQFQGKATKPQQASPETTDEEWEKILKLISDDESINRNSPSSLPTSQSKRTVLPPETTAPPKMPRAEKMLSVEKVESEEDGNQFLLLMTAAVAGGVLLLLVILTSICICRHKKVLCWSKNKMTHDTILNSDLNRFDLQTLRPSKENMNAFLYSIPAFNDVKTQY